MSDIQQKIIETQQNLIAALGMQKSPLPTTATAKQTDMGTFKQAVTAALQPLVMGKKLTKADADILQTAISSAAADHL
jgi:hypothetical protein